MNNSFWDYLLSTASAIEALDDTQTDALPRLMEHLESINVMYHRTFDPADDYEEYVATALCHAIGKVLPKE